MPCLVGFWRGCAARPVGPFLLQSVMNRMHVVSIPYALMKANPLSWIQKVCSYKGTSTTLCSTLFEVSELCLWIAKQ